MLRYASASWSRPQPVMVLCSAAGIEKPAISQPYQRRPATSAITVSVPWKLTRCASPPSAADSLLDTPRAPKSCSLKPIWPSGSSLLASR